jgi:hypothetical protein
MSRRSRSAGPPRVLWETWRSQRAHQVSSALRAWVEYGERAQPVDSWLHNEFQSLSSDGRVPVMRSFGGGCMAPKGFQAFYSAESIDEYAKSEDDGSMRNSLAHVFVYEVKAEEAAVEVRIQMRFPEVYAEIDRLKVEAELRLSIFWPLIILGIVLAWAWSPWALLLLSVPPFLLRDGFQRMNQASDKTWGALMAREVTSPILDAMERAKDQQCRDFQNRWGTSELKVVEEAG